MGVVVAVTGAAPCAVARTMPRSMFVGESWSSGGGRGAGGRCSGGGAARLAPAPEAGGRDSGGCTCRMTRGPSTGWDTAGVCASRCAPASTARSLRRRAVFRVHFQAADSPVRLVESRRIAANDRIARGATVLAFTRASGPDLTCPLPAECDVKDDLLILEGVRVVAAAPTELRDRRAPRGWVWRTIGNIRRLGSVRPEIDRDA